jgi:hypothetical protein
VVEVELMDSARFVLSGIEPEPGYGLVTIRIVDEDDDTPDALIIPVGTIKRIELRKAPEERLARVGFSIPAS